MRRTHGISSAPGPTGRRSRILVLVLALAVLAAGCGGGGGGGAAAAARAPAAQASQATTSTAAAAAAASSPVVASSEKGDVPGLTLAVNQLRRSDPNTVTLVVTVANQGSETYSFDWTWGELGFVEVGNALTFDFSGVYLVDLDGKKKYLVLRDTQRRCLCSTGIYRSGAAIKGLAPGTDATMWAKFPAPPASVSKLTVAVPHFPALDNVPLSS